MTFLGQKDSNNHKNKNPVVRANMFKWILSKHCIWWVRVWSKSKTDHPQHKAWWWRHHADRHCSVKILFTSETVAPNKAAQVWIKNNNVNILQLVAMAELTGTLWSF